MNISYAWIRSLLPGLDASPKQLADLLAMQGAPVDEIVDIGGPLRDIRIARVIEAAQHPNADRLKLCRVDDGTGVELQVVCGAPNARTGGIYPFAPVGAHLPGDVVIRKSKIRGSESQGMLCSARELGLGKDHDGIMELPEDTPIGASLIDVLQLDDARIVVDVTPNRPDLLSHIGVAREIGAATGIELRLPAIRDVVHDFHSEEHRGPIGSANAADTSADRAAPGLLDITIRDSDLCPRYLGLVIRGVTIGPSPAWLSGRLRAIGLRPISNVVDATNFILHELGQPLHAFDLKKSGSTIVVRRATDGELITTLDGVERKLTADMLVIADAGKPMAIAGVMGGANSDVDETTTDIVLECALFQPGSVRATRRALGLSTDASYRFERGVDPDSMDLAMHRASDLILRIAGGTVEGDVTEAGPSAAIRASIDLRLSRITQILGTPFTTGRIVELLSPLGFDVHESGDVLQVRVPGHRSYDVTREEDLVEEIARRHGYDNFPDDLRAFRPTGVPDDAGALLEDRLRTALVALGMHESRTLAFAPESNGEVALMLPLSSAEGYLRNAIVPSLLRRTEFNFTRGQRHVRLFEIATAFMRDGTEKLPREERRVAGVITGSRMQPHWTGDAPAYDIWDLEGIVTRLAQDLGTTLAPVAPGAAVPAWADPSGAWVIARGGIAARVLPAAIDAPAWADPVFAFEIDVTIARQLGGTGRPAVSAEAVAFRPLPAYPAVERDLALLVPHALNAADVLATIQQSAGPVLETAFPFDVYRGKNIDAALRSLALRLRFRAADRTLTDEEVDRAVARVLTRLKEDHGIDRRA